MKKEIEKRIKEVYVTKGEFCKCNGYKSKDLASKLRTVANKIKFVNEFLKPLSLELELKENGCIRSEENKTR